MMQYEDRLSVRLKVSWATGALGVAFMMNAMAFWALFYLVNILGVNPALAGFVVFFPKIFDAITDPIVGTWSDRLKTKGSRRRPFLVAGAIISSLSFLFVFTAPVFENEWLSAGYVFVGLMLFSIGYTIFNVPYLSMPAEMTASYHERTSIHAYRVQALTLGSLLVGSGIPILLDALGRDSWLSYAVMGTAGACVIFVSMMLTWLGTANARYTKGEMARPNLFREVSHVFSNKYFLRLLGVKATQLFGVAGIIAAFAFFVTNVMARSFVDLALYSVVVAICGLISAPFFVQVSKKIGKSHTYILSASINVIAVGSWFFVQSGEPIHQILMRGALLGVASTGNVILAMSMLTDIINYDANKNGERREGIFTAFYTFIEKVTFAFGPLVVGVALAFAGFDKDLSEEALRTPAIRHALLLGVCYIPVVMGLLSIGLLMGYGLKEEEINALQPERSQKPI